MNINDSSMRGMDISKQSRCSARAIMFDTNAINLDANKSLINAQRQHKSEQNLPCRRFSARAGAGHSVRCPLSNIRPLAGGLVLHSSLHD